MSTDIEQQREHFNNIAKKYFEARKHPNHLTLKHLIWNHFFIRNQNLKTQVKSVIEPMCGMAEGYEILKDNLQIDFQYLGFDYSENMVEIAQNYRPNLRVEWGDVSTFKSPIAPVDLIILIGGLHHVFSRARSVIENLATSVKSGGYFLNFEPTHNNLIARSIRKQIYEKNDLFDNDTEQGFEFVDLTKHFEAAGFEKVDEVYPGLLAYVLYYNPDAFPQLNVGGNRIVKSLFWLDRLIWSNWIGRKFSFATITLWRKKGDKV
jgi:SAM-dependent methyltransferase